VISSALLLGETRIVIYTIAAYSITIGILALYGVMLQYRNRLAAVALADAGRGPAPDPKRGFDLGAVLWAPVWMVAHGMPWAGALVGLACVAPWLLYEWALWVPLVLVATIPLAAGAALGFVGNRIAFGRWGSRPVEGFWASQRRWALTGIVLHAFVLPWVAYLTLSAGPGVGSTA
jgi:hypothetical protein